MHLNHCTVDLIWNSSLWVFSVGVNVKQIFLHNIEESTLHRLNPVALFSHIISMVNVCMYPKPQKFDNVYNRHSDLKLWGFPPCTPGTNKISLHIIAEKQTTMIKNYSLYTIFS
ncbi:hypothetical protein ACF0H5_012755 [Mactra antiquata]